MFLDRFHPHKRTRTSSRCTASSLVIIPFPHPVTSPTHSVIYIFSVMSVIWRRGNQRRGVKMETYIYKCESGSGASGSRWFLRATARTLAQEIPRYPSSLASPPYKRACGTYRFPNSFPPYTHTHIHTNATIAYIYIYFRVCVGRDGVLWEYNNNIYILYIRNICVTHLSGAHIYPRGLWEPIEHHK